MQTAGRLESGIERAVQHDWCGAMTQQAWDERALERLSREAVGDDRVRHLVDAANALTAAETEEQVAALLLDHGMGATGASGALLYLTEAGSDACVLAASSGYPDEFVERWRRIPLDAPHPLTDAVRASETVVVTSLTRMQERYPDAVESDDPAPHALVAVPLTPGEQVIGVLGLRLDVASTDELDLRDVATASQLAHAGASGLSRARTVKALEARVGELQQALDSRVLIEQAKGILAERLGISVEEAFEQMRSAARSSQRRIHDVAAAIIESPASPPSS